MIFNSKAFISLLLIGVSCLSVSAQFTCSLEKRSGLYALGGIQFQAYGGNAKKPIIIEKIGDSNYTIKDSSGKVIKTELRRIINKVDDLKLIQNKEGKWGLYRRDFSVIINDEYDDLYYDMIEPGFKCLVKKNQHWGIIDSMGNTILPLVYDNIQLITNRLAFIEKQSEKALFFFENNALFSLNGVCVKKPDYILKPKAILIKKGDLVGAVDMLGNEMIKPQYDNLKYHQIGRKVNEYYFIAMRNGNKGIIDKNGKEIVACAYDKIDIRYDKNNVFNNSLFILNRNGEKYICHSGRIAKDSFDEATFFYKYNETHVIFSNSNKYGAYDTSKNFFGIKPIYEYLDFFNDSLFVVKKQGKYGIINSEEEILLEIKYNSEPLLLKKSENLSTNYIIVVENELSGFVNEDFEIIVEPQYDKILGFDEGLCRVKINEKWGYLNGNLEEEIAFKFEYAGKFKDGKAKVKYNGKELYINKKGDCIENCD